MSKTFKCPICGIDTSIQGKCLVCGAVYKTVNDIAQIDLNNSVKESKNFYNRMLKYKRCLRKMKESTAVYGRNMFTTHYSGKSEIFDDSNCVSMFDTSTVLLGKEGYIVHNATVIALANLYYVINSADAKHSGREFCSRLKIDLQSTGSTYFNKLAAYSHLCAEMQDTSVYIHMLEFMCVRSIQELLSADISAHKNVITPNNCTVLDSIIVNALCNGSLDRFGNLEFKVEDIRGNIMSIVNVLVKDLVHDINYSNYTCKAVAARAKMKKVVSRNKHLIRLLQINVKYRTLSQILPCFVTGNPNDIEDLISVMNTILDPYTEYTEKCLTDRYLRLVEPTLSDVYRVDAYSFFETMGISIDLNTIDVYDRSMCAFLECLQKDVEKTLFDQARWSVNIASCV